MYEILHYYDVGACYYRADGDHCWHTALTTVSNE